MKEVSRHFRDSFAFLLTSPSCPGGNRGCNSTCELSARNREPL